MSISLLAYEIAYREPYAIAYKESDMSRTTEVYDIAIMSPVLVNVITSERAQRASEVFSI